MRFLWGAALGVVCALAPNPARAIDLEFNFRLRGEIDLRSSGSGSVSFSVAFDEEVAAEGAINISGVAITKTGLLSGVAVDPSPSTNSQPDSSRAIDTSFTVPLSLDLDASAVFDVFFSTSSVGHDIDFRSGIRNDGEVFSEAGGLQGLLLESVTLAGGGSLVSGGYELLFLDEATELSAEATDGGVSGTVEELTGPLPSILASANGASLAGVEATFHPAEGPVVLWSAFPDLGGSGGLDIATASLLAVREMDEEMMMVAVPNIMLVEFVPSDPADYNANGLIDIGDYLLWRDTFGDTVTPGDGADGNEDGVVDVADYTVWRDAFAASGAASGSLTTTPEPGAAGLLLAGLLLLPLASRRA